MKYVDLKPEAKRVANQFCFDVIDAVVKNTERVVKLGFRDFPKPPIKSGNLRRNIVGKVISQNENEVVGEVRASTPLVEDKRKGKKKKKVGGRQVEYAKYIEYGTWKMTPRPFMRNGIAKAQKSNDALIKKLIKKTR